MSFAQPYEVITPPAELPVSIQEFKSWAKITSSHDDALIQRIIEGVTDEAEKYTKRDFVEREYETFRNVFGDIEESPVRGCGRYIHLPNRTPVTLRRSKLLSVTGIEYEKDGNVTIFPLSDIRTIKKDAFSQIVPKQSSHWAIPDPEPQSIRITFTAGYGTAADVPAALKNAILAHSTAVYQNRGDCDDGSGGSCSCKFAPAEALSVYNQYRIIDFRG